MMRQEEIFRVYIAQKDVILSSNYIYIYISRIHCEAIYFKNLSACLPSRNRINLDAMRANIWNLKLHNSSGNFFQSKNTKSCKCWSVKGSFQSRRKLCVDQRWAVSSPFPKPRLTKGARCLEGLTCWVWDASKQLLGVHHSMFVGLHHVMVS